MKIPIMKPYLGSEEVEAVKEVLESGWLVQGNKVVEFEERVKGLVGTEYTKACSNCTTALHMALLALGIGKGDTVIVPAYTFVATPNAVEYVGAEPIFADIDIRTFNIDVNSVSWQKHLAASVIIPVHLFGLCADMVKVRDYADRYGMDVIEDAACSLGASTPIGNAGTLSDCSCFSFHPRKSITTGEGGMVTTNNKEIADKIHALRDFGFEIMDIERHQKGASMLPEVKVLGYNYRLTDMQAAIGVVQMRKYEFIVGERMRRAEIYNRELKDVEWLKIPYVPAGYKHIYQSYCVLVGPEYPSSFDLEYIDKWGEFRLKVMAELKDKGIATRGGTHACHMLEYYARKYDLEPTDYPNTFVADKLLMTIPLYAQMTDGEQECVIEAIKGLKV